MGLAPRDIDVFFHTFDTHKAETVLCEEHDALIFLPALAAALASFSDADPAYAPQRLGMSVDIFFGRLSLICCHIIDNFAMNNFP